MTDFLMFILRNRLMVYYGSQTISQASVPPSERVGKIAILQDIRELITAGEVLMAKCGEIEQAEAELLVNEMM